MTEFEKGLIPDEALDKVTGGLDEFTKVYFTACVYYMAFAGGLLLGKFWLEKHLEELEEIRQREKLANDLARISCMYGNIARMIGGNEKTTN